MPVILKRPPVAPGLLDRQPADYQAVHDVADKARPKMARAVETLMLGLRGSVSRGRIEAALRQGPESVMRLYDFDDAFAVAKADVAPLADDVEDLILRIMVDAGDAAGTADGVFDLTNPFAIREAQIAGANLVVGVGESTRQAIRLIIADALRGNATVEGAARQIQQVVGLTPQLARAQFNYETALRAAVRGEAPRGAVARYGLGDRRLPTDLTRLSERRVTDLVEGYGRRALRWRATNIARTETMRAANRGVIQSWMEAGRAGLVDITSVRKVWLVTPDDRLCEICAPLDGQTVAIESTFRSTERGLPGEETKQSQLLVSEEPPIHPMCRCTIIFDVGGTTTEVTPAPGGHPGRVLGPRLRTTHTGDTSALSGKTVREAEDVVAELLDEFPQVPGVRLRWQGQGTDEHVVGYANAASPAGREATIRINADEFLRQMDSRVDEWHRFLVNAEPVEGTLTHEFGHVLNQAFDDIATASQRRRMSALVDTDYGGGQQRFSSLSSPSVYGMENSLEMFAELFSASRFGLRDRPLGIPDEAHELLREFAKLLEEVFG